MGHGRPGQSGGGNEQKRDDEQLKFVGNFRQTRPELWSGSDGPRPGTMGSERGTVGRRVPQWASQWLIGVYCLAAAVFGSGTAAASGCLGTDWIIDEKTTVLVFFSSIGLAQSNAAAKIRLRPSSRPAGCFDPKVVDGRKLSSHNRRDFIAPFALATVSELLKPLQ
ncbi:hypothetical protein AXG93_3415s1430 [Marchantia polymorpha subsp. ruderalis]|uniref:Uncharacterized protein n=1 Tax=Marchantia polymorpha subsp. ruderalis TaxID=1480154 RepID=A0A176WG30_MARPO|nr:hypothetical protein AXG93_3415s1430 [Marchantia polymorpha subsp. ruderalis]